MSGFKVRVAMVGLAAVMACGVMRAQDTNSMDKKFIEDSTQDSLAEIAMAKLALSKTSDPNIKPFAAKMVKDHTMLINSMKPLAVKLGAKPPTEPSLLDKAKLEKLKLQSGISFDRAYVSGMVSDHNDDLKKFMEEEQKTTNPDMKAVVAKGEAVIKQHTEMIDHIAQMGGISTPKMPSCSM